MKKVDDFTLLIPCYNEYSNLEPVLKEIAHTLKKYEIDPEIIFIEDGSSDDSANKLKSLKKENYVEYKVLQNARNLGLGAAIYEGMKVANRKWILWIPGDGQVVFESLIQVYLKHYNSDVPPECITLKTPLKEQPIFKKKDTWRLILTKSWRKILHDILGVDLKDYISYIIQRDLVEEVTKGNNSTGLFNLLIISRSISSKINSVDDFIKLRPRISGSSKVNNPATILKTIWELGKLGFLTRSFKYNRKKNLVEA